MDPSGTRGPTRRRALRALAGALGTGALAGCSSVLDDGGTPTATRTPRCPDDSAVPRPYGDWLAQPAPGSLDSSSLLFATAAPSYLREFPEFWPIMRAFLAYPRIVARAAAVPLDEVERASYLRPPPQSRAAYVVFRYPGEPGDRRAWLDRIRIGVREGGGDLQARELSEVDPYRGFTRYHVVNSPSAELLGYDDEVIVAVPTDEGPVQSDSEARFERLVDTKLGDEHPAYCYRPALRALIPAIEPAAFTRLWFRADDGTFDGGSNRAPAGARARAFSVTPRGAGAADVPWADGGADAERTATADTATAATETPSDPVVDFELAVAFRASEVDEDAVRRHLDEHWLVTDGQGALGFVDPTVERSGQVVTVRETRPLTGVTDG